MRHIVLLFLALVINVLGACNGCENNSVQIPQTALDPQAMPLPTDAKPSAISITDLNFWTEQGRFFVTGLCNNESTDWQTIWLKMEPLDSAGNALTIGGQPFGTCRLMSDAVPPRGRSSFFAHWALPEIAGLPDSIRISNAGSVIQPAGPILIAGQQGGVKMMVPVKQGDSTVSVERAWQVNVTIENPLNMSADHPRAELLIFGTDKKLWMTTLLNPEDEEQRKLMLGIEKDGPMAAGEKRSIGCYVYYDNLPQRLKEIKIGQVGFQAFNARPVGEIPKF
jgi:hypothetical protein